jgi:hypothetical protein
MNSLDLVALLRYLRIYHLSLGMIELTVQLGNTFFNEALKNNEFLTLPLPYETVKLEQEIEDFAKSFTK